MTKQTVIRLEAQVHLCQRSVKFLNSCIYGENVWTAVVLSSFFDPPLLLKRRCAFMFK